VELLRDVALFSACSKRELGHIASLVEEIEVPEGKVLMREGELGRELFVIVDGTANVAVGKKKRVARLGPGWTFGEVSLLDRGPRSATVTAHTDMHLLVLTARAFSTILEESPSFSRKILKAMARRLRAAEKVAYR